MSKTKPTTATTTTMAPVKRTTIEALSAQKVTLEDAAQGYLRFAKICARRNTTPEALMTELERRELAN